MPEVWTRLKGLAEAAELPERARERLAKAERLTVQWLATLAFFFATVTARVEALALPPQLEAAVLEKLIPAIYLERVAARSTAAETRNRVQASSTALLDALRRADHPLQRLAPEASARRTGRRRLRRSVPAQQVLCGGTQRPTVAASSRASPLGRPQARRAYGRAQLSHPTRRVHDRRRAFLRADTPRAVRADPPARALAAATATPPATPAETALSSDAGRGLRAVTGIMNKAAPRSWGSPEETRNFSSESGRVGGSRELARRTADIDHYAFPKRQNAAEPSI
jgi:hypothetical protein